MNTALTLAPRLAVERLRGTRGGGVVDVLAVIAFAVSAFLTLTVAGGTWMFLQRRDHPTDQILETFGLDMAMPGGILDTYIIMAVIACALLVVPVLTLGAGAARLGARGRARRLASLRLMGMTGSEVITMSVVETLVQAVVGSLLGGLLWGLSLPAWQAVAFQGQAIGPAEMLMPWWLIVALVATLLVLAVASTVLGLHQVRISPLGVARQHTPRALRAWRFVAFILALAAFIIFSQSFTPEELDLRVYAFLAAMILIVVAAVNLVGPWALQLIARLGAQTSSAPRLIAMRRIIDDPRGAWRNVSAVALLGMIAAYLATVPRASAAEETDPQSSLLVTDMGTGAIIILAVGLIVAATSTLINQAATVVDRAEQSIAMDRAGMPRAVFTATRRHQVLAPLIITLAASIGVGLLLASPFIALFGIETSGVTLVGATVLLGLALTLGAAESCRPLQHTILKQPHRRND